MILIQLGACLGSQGASSYWESESSLSDEVPTLPEAGERCLMGEVPHISTTRQRGQHGTRKKEMVTPSLGDARFQDSFCLFYLHFAN